MWPVCATWALLGVVGLAIFAAQAGVFTAGAPVQVSVTNPLIGCQPDGGGTNFANAEVEPFVAVNPTNADNIVGVYQQDRHSNGGAKGTTAAVS